MSGRPKGPQIDLNRRKLFLTDEEQRDLELREARDEVRELRAKVRALQGVMACVHRTIAPYAAAKK
jgi:hypothetical protein